MGGNGGKEMRKSSFSIVKKSDHAVILEGKMYGQYSSQSKSISGYRISPPNKVLKKLGWPKEKYIRGTLRIDRNSIVFYREDAKTPLLETEKKYPHKVELLRVARKDKVLNRVSPWLLTAFITGYGQAKIECESHLVAEDLSNILSQEFSPIFGKIDVKKSVICVTFPEVSLDFPSQIMECFGELERMFELTSELFQNITSRGEEYIKSGVDAIKERERKMDYVAWRVWRNVHIALRSGDYLKELRRFDPYELMPYFACSKILERSGDHCAGIACMIEQIFEIYRTEVGDTEKMGRLEDIFSGLSEMVGAFPAIYNRAVTYFLGDIEEMRHLQEAENFRKEHVREYCDRLQEIYGGVDPVVLVRALEELDTTTQIKISKLFGGIDEKIRRLITYPYNIILIKDTGVMYTEDLMEDIPEAYKKIKENNSSSDQNRRTSRNRRQGSPVI